MIRAGTLQDVPEIERLLLRLKRRTEFVTVKIEFERGRKAVRQCISSPQGLCVVAEHDSKLTGVLLAVKQHLWYSTTQFVSDLAIYSQRRGDGARLLAAMLEWADEAGALTICGVSSGRHGVAMQAWYQTQGFTRVGGLYIRERSFEAVVKREVA